MKLNTKQIILIFALSLIFLSCKKDNNSSLKTIDNTNSANKLKISDTYGITYQFGAYNSTTGTTHVQLTTTEAKTYGFSAQYYQIVNSTTGALVVDLGYHNIDQAFDIVLPVGTFQFYCWAGVLGLEGESSNSAPFTVSAQPATAPVGTLNLYRYLLPTQNKHFYTTDWNELGSNGFGYHFEKVQGYVYDNASRTSNLTALYRYYNVSSNDHYMTTNYGSYSGYTYERIVGYISTVSNGISNMSLNEYFSSNGGHVYTSPPENLQSPFVYDGIVGYIAPIGADVSNSGLVALYRYYNSTTNRHVYTNNYAELGSNSQGYVFEKIQGYMYDNSSRANNLVMLYRYFNPTSNDHYLSTSYTTYAGYNYEGTMGYISTISSGLLNLPLDQYYNAAAGHFYASPPEVVPQSYPFENITGYLVASQ